MHLEQNLYHFALLATEKMEMPTNGLFRVTETWEILKINILCLKALET